MSWSTSELARLASTTTATVRHYHRMGLLEEPERRSNGYKEYTAVHLVRLLQIRRLADRGVRLTRIEAILRDDAHSAAVLEEVDAELEASMRDLARARAELALLREHRARADTPSGFEALSRGLSERQRSLLTLFSTVMDPDALTAFREGLTAGNDVDEEFEALPATADAETVDALARRMAATVAEADRERPRLRDPVAGSPVGEDEARKVLGHAFAELFNPAQLRALQRVDEIRRDGTVDTPRAPESP
ncbi:helix-turn-helix domain-containing protein [Brachybacterium sp. AOP43-C2-M15]|uniref:helix-turn-helix domain-containing protein n=1 Tax=Brachybacterium sp. AOP43-C2-M15 TaxID=3457661 RepID=UPI0040349633